MLRRDVKPLVTEVGRRLQFCPAAPMQAINSHNSMGIMTTEDALRVLDGSYGDEPQSLDIVVTRQDVLDEAGFRSTGDRKSVV